MFIDRKGGFKREAGKLDLVCKALLVWFADAIEPLRQAFYSRKPRSVHWVPNRPVLVALVTEARYENLFWCLMDEQSEQGNFSLMQSPPGGRPEGADYVVDFGVSFSPGRMIERWGCTVSYRITSVSGFTVAECGSEDGVIMGDTKEEALDVASRLAVATVVTEIVNYATGGKNIVLSESKINNPDIFA